MTHPDHTSSAHDASADGHPAPPVPSGAPVATSGPDGAAPLGTIRSTGVCVLLFFVTLGIYGLYWYYATHGEIKRHTGSGLGGGFALLIALFVGIVSPFIISNEVGELHARRGSAPPVTAKTALWYFPGILVVVGPFIWFARTNGALNAYWRSLGATG